MRPKIVTIRIPHDLWVELRRAQERGSIRSIQQACIAGLQFIVSEGEEAKDGKEVQKTGTTR